MCFSKLCNGLLEVQQVTQLTVVIVPQLTQMAKCLPAVGAELAKGASLASPDVDIYKVFEFPLHRPKEKYLH